LWYPPLPDARKVAAWVTAQQGSPCSVWLKQRRKPGFANGQRRVISNPVPKVKSSKNKMAKTSKTEYRQVLIRVYKGNTDRDLKWGGLRLS
jgi:hypothetical protein